jgi:hypothetical protein
MSGLPDVLSDVAEFLKEISHAGSFGEVGSLPSLPDKASRVLDDGARLEFQTTGAVWLPSGLELLPAAG